MIAFKMRMSYLESKESHCYSLTRFNRNVRFAGSIKTFCEEYPYESVFFAARDTGKIYKTARLGELRLFGRYGYDADNAFALLFSHECSSFFVFPIGWYQCLIHRDSLSGRKLSMNTNLDRLEVANKLLIALLKLPKEDVSENDLWNSVKGTIAVCDIAKEYPFQIIRFYFRIQRHLALARRFFHGHAAARRYFPSKTTILYTPLLFSICFQCKRMASQIKRKLIHWRTK